MAEKEQEGVIEQTGRARVRERLIAPLQAQGMRFKHGTSDKVAKGRLAAIADDLAYMSDGPLAALRTWLESHGEGSARCFWPSRITINSVAEAFEPRPLEELPALARWFASNAGRVAQGEDRLVAEYEFFRTHKRPPIHDGERAKITAKAEDWRRQVELTRDRLRRAVPVGEHDRAFLQWYDRRLAHVTGLLSQEDAA